MTVIPVASANDGGMVMTVPSIPLRITAYYRYQGIQRVKTFNATDLDQAVMIRNREQRSLNCIRIETSYVIDEWRCIR